MAFSAHAIANYFIGKAAAARSALSPMKLQKLMYYAQGWSLAIADRPLFDEQIEAWKWGPVIRSIYHQFKEFGNSPITKKATSMRMGHVDGRLKFWSVIKDVEQEGKDNPDQLSFAKAIMDRIWEVYSGYSPIQLSNMTHEAGSPWDDTVKQYGGSPPKGTDIPQELMTRFFKKLAKKNA